MEKIRSVSRRIAVKSSVFGLLGASIPNLLFSQNVLSPDLDENETIDLFHRYPSIDDKIVAEVVGASHFNFNRVKELVSHRPELARATWDWAFGDWETALGAASHVGRRDIAGFLMEHGARADIFTLAMFGRFEAVKAMIESTPGIESIAGPHGISLLRHARAGLRANYGISLSDNETTNSNRLIEYLEKLGTADYKSEDIELPEAEKEKYLGDYKYGDGDKDGFTVKLNMRKNLSLGKLGKSGGALFQKSPNVFTYNGITSVEVRFSFDNKKVISLTIIEPDLTLKAMKVG